MTDASRILPRLPPEEWRLLKRQLAALFVIISLLNLGFYWQRAFRDQAARRNWQSVMRGWDGLAWYAWMLAAPATLFLIRRHPFQPERPWRSAATLIAGSAGIYFVVTNTRYLFRVAPNLWLPPEAAVPMDPATYVHTQLERMPLDFLTYCGLFAASYAVDYYSKYRRRADELMALQLRMARLESELARTQLTALRRQLQPHFLFNSFNAIATLVRQGRGEAAVDTITRLAELLRFVMEKFDGPDITLREEMDFIRCYLEVERVRLGERLRAVLAIDERVLAGVVPSLLLQPLVENAVKHGIARRRSPGEIRVSARREGGRLLVEVSDDGPERSGQVAPASSTTGIGLSNTRSRLDHAYGADYRLELVPQAHGGMTALLDLPWREAATS